MTTLSISQTAMANLVRDGSFDNSTGTTLPATWQAGGAVKNIGYDRSNGVASLKLTGTPGQGMQLSQSVAVQPGTEYLFTARIKSPDRVVVGVRTIFMSYHQQGAWQTVAGLVRTAEEGTVTVQFNISGLSSRAPVVQLADISLKKLDRQPALERRFNASETVLVQAGQPNAIIVYPSTLPIYETLAARVQQAVAERTGVTLPMASDSDATLAGPPVLTPEHARQNLILVGRLGINRGMWPAYNRFLDATDGYYPGGDGYVVRTASNVMRNGKNHIILGGSSDAGAERAVEEFIAFLNQQENAGSTLKLPWLLQVELGGACLEAVTAHDALWAANPEDPGIFPIESGYGVIRRWYENTMGYYWTGWDSYKTRSQLTLQPVLEEQAYVHHYVTEFLVRTYDMIDDSPLMTDDQRVQMDAYFSSVFCDFYTEKGDLMWMTVFSPPYQSVGINNRHQIAPWMGDLTLAAFLSDYFKPSGDVTTLAEFRRSEKASFMRYVVEHQWDSSFPGAELAETEEELGLSMLRFALENEYYTLFESGNAHNVLLLERVNHLTGAWVRPSGKFEIDTMLGVLASYYHDGRYVTLRNRIPTGPDFMRRATTGIHKYISGDEVPAAPAHDFAGVRLPEMAPQRQAGIYSLGGEQFHVTKLRPNEVFDFGSMRSGFEPDDDFVALNGLATVGHLPGAIFALASRGVNWLGNESAQQYASGSGRYFESNGLHLLRIDQLQASDKPFPAAARFEWKADFHNAGGISFSLDPFSNTRWERSVIWIRPGLFVVRDAVTARQPGKFDMLVNWRPTGTPSWNGTTWTSTAQAKQFRLTPLGNGFSVQQNIDEWLAGNEDHLHFRHTASLDLSAGTSATAWAVLQAMDPATEAAITATSTADGGVLLTAADNPSDQTLVITGPAKQVQTDAKMIVLSSRRIQMINGTLLTLNNTPILKSERPLSLQADHDSGRMIIDNPGRAQQVAVIGANGQLAAAIEIAAGYQELPLPEMPASVAAGIDQLIAVAAVQTATPEHSAAPSSEWTVEDHTDRWTQTWQYDGLQQSAIVATASSPATGIVDLGRVVDLAEIRPGPITRFWFVRKLPDDIWVSAGDANGNLPAPDDSSWIKLTQERTWKPGVQTHNYGETHAIAEDSQVLLLNGVQARYIRAEGAAQLLYLDRQQRTTYLPLTLHAAGDNLFVQPRIWPKYVGRVAHGPDKIAMLTADGQEVYQYESQQKLMDIQLVYEEGRILPILATADARIEVLNEDGTIGQEVNLATVHDQFNAQYGKPNTRSPAGGHVMPFGVGRWKPDAGKPTGFAVARYHSFSFVNGDGTLDGLLVNGSYVQAGMLPQGIDFDGDGTEEQICLARSVVFKLYGPRNERVVEPTGHEFYPQIFQSHRLMEPTWDGRLDGSAIYVFQGISTGAPAPGRKRYVAIVRDNYLGIYDGLENSWAFTWVPSVPLTAAAITLETDKELRFLLATADSLLWDIRFNGSLQRQASFKAHRFPVPVTNIDADTAEAGAAFISTRRGLYHLTADGSLQLLADGRFSAAVRVPGRRDIAVAHHDGSVSGLRETASDSR